MKIDLEVLTSTNIKRKKPWPHIIWIGEEQESLLLLDAPGKRISVLYVPSGKTRRKLPKFSPFIDQVVVFSNSKNGRYLLGLLQTREVFIWHKDKDVVRFVPGLDALCKSNVVPERAYIAASDDCEQVFVSLSCCEFYVWLRDRSSSILHDRDPRLKGSWHKVSIPQGMYLPTTEAAESNVAAIFYENAVLGSCLQCSVIFNKQDMLCIATLVLKFPDATQALAKNVYSSEWSLLEYPFQQMHPDFQPISSHGAYVTRYCPSGQVLAVAANQNSPSKTAMLFVSPLTDTVLVGNLKGCGAVDPSKVSRQYWVNDISWTADSLFVSCMMRNGSVCLVPRLGEPIPIQTQGCSVEMGPALYLPLHPAMMVSVNGGQLEASMTPQDPLQQQFSVSSHPSLPILLYSDGFLVTLLQLPVEMTSVTLMTDMVLESARFLKQLYKQENLDMTVADAYKLSKGQKDKHHNKQHQDKRRQYEFEMAEISLNGTRDSEVSIIETTDNMGLAQFGAVGDLDAGKIMFGEPEMINIDLNATFSGLDASDALLKYLEESMSALTSVWKLAVSYTDIWTSEVDNIVRQTVHNLSKIFTVVLDCHAVEAIIPVLTPRQSTAIQNPRVYNIIVAYRNLLQLLRFDTFNQHLIPVVLKLVHRTISVMLQSPQLEESDPRLKTLFGCHSLIKHAESCLNRVYGWVVTHNEKQGSTNQSVPQEQALPGKRLASTWKLLYNYVIQHQSQVAMTADEGGELPHLEKLIASIQLEVHDTELTPRQSSKLTAAWLQNTLPFGLLSEQDSFVYTPTGLQAGGSASIHVGSYHSSSSQRGTQSSSIPSSYSPSAPVSPKQQSSTLKVSALTSSSSKCQTSSSSTPSPVNTGTEQTNKVSLVSKMKSALSKAKSPSASILKSSPSPKLKRRFLPFSSPSKQTNEDIDSPMKPIVLVDILGNDSTMVEEGPSDTDVTVIDKGSLDSGNFHKVEEVKKQEKASKLSLLRAKEQYDSIIKGGLSLFGVKGSNKQENTEIKEVAKEEKLNDVNGDVKSTMKKKKSERSKPKASSSDKLSVDGEHEKAVSAWRDQLKKLSGQKKDSPKMAKMLHSLLYTHLLKDELSEAVEFMDSLILQARVDSGLNSQELMSCDYGARPPLMTMVSHRSQDSEDEEMVPCIRNKSIRKTVQTMARYMAAYFSNSTMFIYPPHNAQPLPCLPLGAIPTKVRIIPKYHEEITNTITRLNLGSVWTTERVVEYLLLSGLACETTWFAHKMGDWKSAFLLSVAHTTHLDMAPFIYGKRRKEQELPPSLQPMSILQEKLQVLLQPSRTDQGTRHGDKSHSRYNLPVNDETNIGQLTKTLHDMLTTGVVCGVELAPWLLTSLTGRLKSAAARLPALVPQDFYLPAPPLYCPQPAETNVASAGTELQHETEVRQEISSLLQLILVILDASHLSLPTARWYIQELFKVQERAAQYKATTEGPCLELPEFLQQYKILRSDISDYKDEGQVSQVLARFRDMCALVWMLHVRDELSLQLRKRGSRLSNDLQGELESPESTLGNEYTQQCFKILKLAVNLLAFTQYLGEDTCIRKVILSLILDLPPTEDTADVLAEYFYAATTYDSEIQERLEKVINMWQSVEIIPEDDGKSARLDDNEEVRRSLENNEDEDDDGSVRKSVTFFQASPRAKTLSVYFHKQCDVVMKVLKKKRKLYGLFEEFVFSADPDADATFRSQPGSGTRLELSIGARPYETRHSFFEFLDRFFAISFTKVVEKEAESGRTPMYPILMPFSRLIRETEIDSFMAKNDESYKKKTSSVVMASPRAKILRSQSESYALDSPDSRNYSTSPKKSFVRSSSSGDVQQMGRPGSGKAMMSPSRNKVNMTGMASRFFQSEEVLYRDPSDTQDAHWILDVNFGQRYMALEQLLDYLQNWARKQHSLGLHGKYDKELGVKPTMRIEVPTQLVVLSLWLLENKYSNIKRPKQEEQSAVAVVTEQQAQRDQMDAKARALATLEELTEHDSFTQISNIPKSNRSVNAQGRRSGSHSPAGEVSRSAGFNISADRTLEHFRSISTTQEETEQVKSAYKKVLDGGDDSSSLEVSSLEEDNVDETGLSVNSNSHDRKGRSRSPKHRRAVQRSVESSPEVRNRSTLNHTLPFVGSPERLANSAPKTSTPNRSPTRRGYRTEDLQQDLSRISLPPSGGNPGSKTAPPSGGLNQIRAGLLNADQVPLSNQITSDVAPINQAPMAGQDLAAQLQFIVRGELRRMMEVQHQSMMAMMGAFDGQPLQAPAQPNPFQPHPPTAGQSDTDTGQSSGQGKPLYKDVLKELHNLEQTEGKPKHSKSPGRGKKSGKENVDSTLRMSALGHHEQIDVYRVESSDPNRISFFPKFLRVPAEKDNDVKFPRIPMQAWQSQDGLKKEGSTAEDMPLLHVERTVPAHIFPESRRQQPPTQLPPGGFFQPPQPVRKVDSPDSGIGIPLLKMAFDDGQVRRQPRFGELLPPDILDVDDPRERAERLRERYMEEFHRMQSKKTEVQVKQTFGNQLLQLRQETSVSPRTPRKSPRRSPRKSPRHLSESEQLSSRREKVKKKVVKRPKTPDSVETSEKSAEERELSRKSKSASVKRTVGEGGEESEEDATRAESMEEDEEEEEVEEEEVEETEEEVLHDGYVFPPGEFEAYLALEKQLAKTKDTHARIQLKTALRLQQQRLKENWKRPKVDFATNTQEYVDAETDPDYAAELASYRTSEKATSITKDTGVDPIQEAVIEYNKTRQANVLPPDIYMSLRFAQTGETAAAQGAGQQEAGHNYLNVVDLDASAILNDLQEKDKSSEPQLEVSPLQQHLANRIGVEEQQQLAPRSTPVVHKPTRADELTLKMFESKVQGEDKFSMVVLPHDKTDSKFLVMQKLRDMNSQLEAIDHMSRNMEREFRGTRLALHTLDEMTNAMQPAEKMEEGEEDGVLPAAGSPVPSRKSPRRSARATARSTARSSGKSLKSVGKSTEGERTKRSVELSKMSGLSGISDIIGEMVAKGDIALEDVGITGRQAELIQQKISYRHDEEREADLSLEEIRKMAGADKPSGRDKEELQAWMLAKRQERTEEYRRNLEILREKEARPYRPKHPTHDRSFNTQTLIGEKEEARKHFTKEYMTKRLDDAQSLLGNILTDKPELPKEPPARRVSPQRKPIKDRSPVSRDRKAALSPARSKIPTRHVSPPRKPQGILKTRDVSPPVRVDEFDEQQLRKILDDSDDFDISVPWIRQPGENAKPDLSQVKVPPGQPRPVLQPRRIDVSPVRSSSKKPPGVPKLSLGLEDVEEEPKLTTQISQDTTGLRQTVDTTGELADYYRAVEALDVTGSQDRMRDSYPHHAEPQRQPAQAASQKKTYKAKSFKDLVRLQRPHVTRKQPHKLAGMNLSQLQMDSETDTPETTARSTARTELTQREKEMIYGSKRLPGKKPVSTTPRRVKTYAERLQEMKPKETYSTPVAPKSHLGSSVASASARDPRQMTRVVKPKHKPMTYVEQLQKLNAGHHKPRMGQTTTIVQRPMVKSHKPAHKPKTYAEQLQELQPPKPTQGPPSRRPHVSSMRRSRPYKDPWTTADADAESVVSAWSMSDDVKHILYDDAASSVAVGQSASYAPSEPVSDYYDAIMGDSYAASVDIDDLVKIADDGSMSGGSIAEFIDWDQIDDLIADVR